MTGSNLWAMYVQATRTNASGRTARRQWVVLPPLPPQVIEHEKLDGVSGVYLMFNREQAAPENRVKWRSEFVDVHLLMRDLPERIGSLNSNSADRYRWSVSPVVTAQMTPAELVTLYRDPQTPYQLLRRFEKVARVKHNIAI